MIDHESFDPRAAALNHAGWAASEAGDESKRPEVVVAETANALACGLVYVGDQLGKLIQEVREGNLSGVVNLLEQLDVTLNNTLVDIDRTLNDKL